MLRELREQKDKMKHRKKYWELAGTRLGKVLDKDKYGEIKEEGEVPRLVKGKGGVEDEDRVDYKKSAGFSAHLDKMSSDSVSHFARTKSLREQREFLPVYKVKRYLMNVIRDNQIVLIVGQTGSGALFLTLVLFFH